MANQPGGGSLPDQDYGFLPSETPSIAGGSPDQDMGFANPGSQPHQDVGILPSETSNITVGSLPDQDAFAQPGGSGGIMPDQEMAFANPGASQPHQDAEPGPSSEVSEKVSPPHLLRSGIQFMRNKKPLKPQKTDTEVISERARSFDAAYSYLKAIGFLPYETPKCPNTHAESDININTMGLYKYKNGNGFILRCKEHRGYKVSVHAGSPLEGSHITQQQWVNLAYCWANETPNKKAEKFAGVANKTVTKVYAMFRENCKHWLKAHPMKLGGAGKTVEVDETCISGKLKHHKGAPRGKQIWLFGMIERCKPGVPRRMVICPIPDKKKTTLWPLIREHVLPASTINSDGHKSYTGIEHMDGVDPPYQHNFVEHKYHYVCPKTGTHTNGIESAWAHLKLKQKQMYGQHRTHINSYVHEHLWRQQHGVNSTRSVIDTMDIALLQMGQQHRNE